MQPMAVEREDDGGDDEDDVGAPVGLLVEQHVVGDRHEDHARVAQRAGHARDEQAHVPGVLCRPVLPVQRPLSPRDLVALQVDEAVVLGAHLREQVFEALQLAVPHDVALPVLGNKVRVDHVPRQDDVPPHLIDPEQEVIVAVHHPDRRRSHHPTPLVRVQNLRLGDLALRGVEHVRVDPAAAPRRVILRNLPREAVGPRRATPLHSPQHLAVCAPDLDSLAPQVARLTDHEEGRLVEAVAGARLIA
eukprot:CAMPEP_0206225218 /NCGR_PEP_ID=MMETSP0047_2-20121206/7435_1 /ASSEMBLY_ACC=CAM_ASM_000192 /TAXON_ID=195065 /ORGANISM="Chroomonas mesostigmatica_cf, Strain CCMP1168" /LENGTH=246 /DNA_ID=CAMNT_0053648213 /DNA_START=284 /DNA_END=1023 /DNA_ORIENTATION=-